MEGAPFGRYRLMELLGRGGMGEVWRAFDTDTDRVVAVKVLSAHLAADPEFQQRFRREARAAAMLNEPHVVPIHHFGVIDDRLYVDMRFIEGRDLQVLLNDGPMEVARAVSILEQIGMALDAAHEAGLVHRDVKPSNILVARRDFAYLIDFGIARAASETGLTATGSAIGTWAYMAPERISGTSDVDARSDVYALACVLHECLTGHKPYPGTTFERLAGAHLFTPPPQPSQIRPGLSDAFDTVIATGMAKDPQQRYQTTMELTAAAVAAITDPSTTAVIPKPVLSQPQPPGPNAPPPVAPHAATVLRSSPTPPPPKRRSEKALWNAAGIDPIRIITRTADFLTLRCYLDEEPIFLGSRNGIHVFRNERRLRRFLADGTSTEMSGLDTFTDIIHAALDGSLRVGEVDAENVYQLVGLADDVYLGPQHVDPVQLNLAVELFTDIAQFVGSKFVDDQIRPGQPLTGLIEAVVAGRRIPERQWSGTRAERQVRKLEDFVESLLLE